MTALENKALKYTQEAFNVFARLPVFDKRVTDDKSDFAFHVRALQNIILSRGEIRKMRRIKSVKK